MGFKKIVFVADYFLENYLGGSEKSLDAILKAAPPEYQITKVQSGLFAPGDYQPHKDFIVLGNFNLCSPHALKEVGSRFRHAVIESDFKYCKYRLPEMHSAGAVTCTCENDPEMAHVRELYYTSSLNIFKSQRHLDRHLKALPRLKTCKNFVLSVTYTPEDLAYLLELRYARKPFEKIFPWDKPTYAIYDSQNWIKGKTDAIEFCKGAKLKYKLINEKDDRVFQKKLSEFYGLVFLPRGLESASRIVVEAKIMGLDVILNNNVGVGGDPFIEHKIQDMIAYLRERPAIFWQELSKVL